MDNRKRNQLIGFITLVLFALVFSPYILTDKSTSRDNSIPLLSIEGEENTIIVEPMLVTNDEVQTEQTDDVVLPQPIEPATTTSSESPFITESNQSSSTQTDSTEQGENRSYSIQLVALKNKQKIEELVALLRLNNYDVYLDPPNAQDQQIIRLLVGQFPTKGQAEMVVIDLQHLTKLKGIVVSK